MRPVGNRLVLCTLELDYRKRLSFDSFFSKYKGLFGESCFAYAKQDSFFTFTKQVKGEIFMLQIKNLTLTHKKDLRVILSDFNMVLNAGDKAVIIGEEGN